MDETPMSWVLEPLFSAPKKGLYNGLGPWAVQGFIGYRREIARGEDWSKEAICRICSS